MSPNPSRMGLLQLVTANQTPSHTRNRHRAKQTQKKPQAILEHVIVLVFWSRDGENVEGHVNWLHDERTTRLQVIRGHLFSMAGSRCVACNKRQLKSPSWTNM